MNTSWQWLRSFPFVRRVADVVWAAYSWIAISMFLLLGITVLLVVLPIALIVLVPVLIFHPGKVSIYVKRSTRNRTRFSNVETLRK